MERNLSVRVAESFCWTYAKTVCETGAAPTQSFWCTESQPLSELTVSVCLGCFLLHLPLVPRPQYVCYKIQSGTNLWDPPSVGSKFAKRIIPTSAYFPRRFVQLPPLQHWVISSSPVTSLSSTLMLASITSKLFS